MRVTSNGAAIPSLGFGTYGMRGRDLARFIPLALQAGFRHIDTAQIYANEGDVGEGIVSAGLPRSEVFITTKVWIANCAPERLASSVDESLRKLRTDYVDLLLLHWPCKPVPLADQIGALNDVVRSGKARYIGVSNYNSQLMAEAIRLSDLPLVANQFEYHPYLDQRRLVSAAREANLAVTAYCAMAVGRVFSDPTLAQIARRYGRSIPQIVLRWLVQQDGVTTLSRTTNPARLAENASIFDFHLQDADMARIFGLAAPNSRIVDPPGLAPDWD